MGRLSPPSQAPWVLAAASALLLACSPKAEAPPGLAVVQLAQEPDALNPYRSPMAIASQVAPLFYSGLVLLDDHGRWQPDLAEQVPTLANGLVRLEGGKMRVRYRLRAGVRWHDGRPLTARDVWATWRFVMAPQSRAVSQAGYDLIERVALVDERTLELHFARPFGPFLELFPFVLPDRPGGPGQWDRRPLGTGPFALQAWSSGEQLVLQAFPHHFRGRPGLERLVLRVVPSDGAALALWQAGELDLLQGAAPALHDHLQRLAPERLRVTPQPTWEHLLFNLDRPVPAELAVRRAIAHLISREELNARAYDGLLLPAYSELPPDHWAHHPALEHRYPHDPTLAARRLEEAGWRLGARGLRWKGGRPLRLTLVTTSDKPARSLAAQLWRKQWREVGIELVLDKVPPSVAFGSARTGGRLASGQFDLALIASLVRPDPDTSYRWRSDQVPPLGQNRARYRSQEADRWLRLGQGSLDPGQRKQAYAGFAERFALDLPALPLLYWVGLDAVGPRLTGFRPNPTLRGNFWNAWAWRTRAKAAPP